MKFRGIGMVGGLRVLMFMSSSGLTKTEHMNKGYLQKTLLPLTYILESSVASLGSHSLPRGNIEARKITPHRSLKFCVCHSFPGHTSLQKEAKCLKLSMLKYYQPKP